MLVASLSGYREGANLFILDLSLVLLTDPLNRTHFVVDQTLLFPRQARESNSSSRMDRELCWLHKKSLTITLSIHTVKTPLVTEKTNQKWNSHSVLVKKSLNNVCP